ncbi:hypothetical protein ALP8811_00832 [Aliiroseovarius pelagivivens]|uniref:DUF1330 domain-containing protein n=1 Tax=Aliiroseovarius pelagivivens TaxID=1639690 RepID=A0A2R8AIJ0_9RHOB|nr:DUF1330 domain-containing protein [Aliiroseovarius pelagivivens]SPF75838.1 hypothetical protein ALP8811_00832 [Aliiroseovarius pelagivivens]
MAKGYWIGRVDVDDLERYQDYIKANGAAFEAHGARFLIRGGQFESVEGQSRTRNVVIEFPNYQAALDCYNSEVYQAAKSFRDPVSEADIIIIEGYDG